MPTALLRPLHLSHAADARDGGIAMAVADLVRAQQALGIHSDWLTASQFPSYRRDCQLVSTLISARPPLLHLHGLWRSPTRIAPCLEFADLPLVIAPHGMLDPGALAISQRKKQLVWHLWERRALCAASCLQALCGAEASAIRALLPQVPIALIPNGVTLPDLSHQARTVLPRPTWTNAIPDGERVLLFLGRFHRKKGIQPLLQAWHSVSDAAARAGWWLALVGYGDDGLLDHQLRAHPIPRALAFGPVFDAAKQNVLRAASAFILPSFSEGLPMAALEAMAHQLPCLLSGACNLPEAFSAGAALSAEPDVVALAASLRQLFALSPADRAAMGVAGRSLVASRFSWPQVAEQTLQLYRWILDGADRPGFVELT